MPFELSRLVIAVTITLTTSFGGIRSHSQSIQLEQAGQKGNSGRIGSFFDIRSGNLNQYGQWLVVGGAAWMTLNILATLASLLICASFYLCCNSAQSKAEKASSRPASLLLAETLGLPSSFELPKRSWQQATEDRIKFVLLEYEIRQPVKSAAAPSYLETDKPDMAALTGLGISRLSYLSPPALVGPDFGFNALQAPPVIPPRVSSYHAAFSTGLEGIHQMLAAQDPAAAKDPQLSSPQQQAQPDHLRPFDVKATDSPGRRSPSLVSVVRAYSPLLAAAGDALAKRRSVQPQVGTADVPKSNREEKDVVDEASAEASTWSISFVEADESEEGATAEAAEDTTRESGQSYRIWNMFPEQRQQIAAARAAKEMAEAVAAAPDTSSTAERDLATRAPLQEALTPLEEKSYPTLQVSSVDQGITISYGTPLHDIIEEAESAAGSLASRPSDNHAEEGDGPGEQGDADK